MRELTYVEALNEGLTQALEQDERVLLIGQGVTSPWYVGASTKGLFDRFGPDRVIDTPVSENAITGAAVGAALAGMRPIVVHPRMDFMYYALDQICNHAANWRQMFGGDAAVPVVFWGIINRGGEQAAQHSQALHALFAHIPGLKVVLPSTPHDVKGLLRAAVEDDNPVGESADGYTDRAQPGFVERAIDRICERIPAMEAGNLHSDQGGYDGITPDLRAILGQIGPEGFYAQCGFSGTGFKIAPAVGLCMSELIVDGEAKTVDITPFDPNRFERGDLLKGEHAYDDIWH